MIELYELAGTDPDRRFSPYCWRIRMALAHKGLEPATVAWHFGERDRLPGAPEVTTVPVIVDDGQVVADSTAIAHYLETEYANRPSLFGCAVAEAHCRFIISWTDMVLQPAIFPMIVADIAAHVRPEVLPEWRASRERVLGVSLESAGEGREERLPGFRTSLKPLRRALDSAPFLGGEEPSYADYTVFGAFQWARCVSPFELLAKDDALVPWRERVLDLFDGLARQAPVAS